ncbi:peptide deformylase [Maridesulfovibrio hydrothermalis]|uniref:Peptide deformylase n=1 Tax=Maridesulfovibrio hydrothermalis AM13 = DSM 14728 TaxID=1121451 RepID=L0R9I4_9BACT|nr:peptide deformylase [Maridesulfovibrio hydrothermalis]CCO22860.1 peptide deformylase [Maridesulfovibrio hydrothermalis AM13 = DSM 14728]
MRLEILKYPEASLNEVCTRVEEVTPELKEAIDNMIETMYDDDGVGLAAPQVGLQKRLIVIDPSGPKERTALQVIINPEIIASEGKVDSEESCLSCPSFRCVIKRSEKVTVTGQDIDGNDIKIEADEFLAIVLQHEIDHLDGTLIVNRVGRLKRAMYDKKIKKWQKSTGK